MIQNFTFGKIIIDGKTYDYDLKIKQDKVIRWDYIKHHTVTVKDIEELFDNTDYVVVGIGDPGAVVVEDDVKALAEKRGIKLIIEPTAKAAESFNKLIKTEKVNAIVHLTC